MSGAGRESMVRGVGRGAARSGAQGVVARDARSGVARGSARWLAREVVRRASRGVACGLLFTWLCVQAGWGAEWRRVRSANFELYTDAGKGRAAQVLSKLELARQHFSGWGLPPLPVRVVLFGDEKEFAPLRSDATTKGFFQSGAERDSIVLLDAGEGTLRGAAHEYVHLVLHHAAGRLPRWQEEGLAEFHSTLRADGEIRTGELIPSHIAILRQEGTLPAAKMAAAARGDVTAIGGREIPVFYAQSWALVHALHAAAGGGAGGASVAGGGEARRYLMPPFAAIGEKTLKEMVEQLPQYLRRPMSGWKTGQRALPVGAIEEEPVPKQRAALVVIDLALRVGSVKYARALLAGAEAAYPDDPEVLHEAGVLALASRDDAGAREKFARAVQNKYAVAQSFFELALLERDALGPNAERVRELLSEAVGRNSHHAEAMYLLGQMEESQGRAAKAVEWFERAVKVLPRQSRMWYALAMARHEEGQAVASRAAAQKAMATAETPQEREQAEAALGLSEDALTVPRRAAEVKKPAEAVPDAWRQAKGDAVVRGELREMVCGQGVSARLRVWSQGSWRELTLDERTRATGNAVELQCGVQKPAIAVEVSYEATSQRAVSIEFQ